MTLGFSSDGEAAQDYRDMVEAELYESSLSTEEKVKPELELERECEERVEIVDMGEDVMSRGGAGMAGNSQRMGVSQVGSRISSAMRAKSSSSSCSTSSNCCA